MKAAVSTCKCVSFDGGVSLRFCEAHHRFYKGPKELASVTSVLKACWPVKPNWAAADPATLENARERGILVDDLFSAYVAGRLTKIPAGTREDSIELFFQLKEWYDDLGVSCGASQVMLSDDDIAGITDVVIDGFIWDVKTVFSLDPQYEIQVGAYADMYEHQFRDRPRGIGIVHVNKRFKKPQIFELDLKGCSSDWRHMKAAYLMAMRRVRK